MSVKHCSETKFADQSDIMPSQRCLDTSLGEKFKSWAGGNTREGIKVVTELVTERDERMKILVISTLGKMDGIGMCFGGFLC